MDSCLCLQTSEAPCRWTGLETQPVRPVLTQVVPVLQASSTRPQPFQTKCDLPTRVCCSDPGVTFQACAGMMLGL